MLAGNDVSQILLSVLVSYFGNYGNRPKWMAVGVWASSISCFIATLPHVFYKGDLEHLEAGAPNTSEWDSFRYIFRRPKNQMNCLHFITDLDKLSVYIYETKSWSLQCQ